MKARLRAALGIFFAGVLPFLILGCPENTSPTTPPGPTATPTATLTITPLCTPILRGNATFTPGVSGISSRLFAIPCTITTTGYVRALYVNHVNVNEVRGGIYSDSASAPGTLITESAAIPVVVGWNRLDLVPAELGPGVYWLAAMTRNNPGGLRSRAILDSEARARDSNSPFDPLPTDFGSSHQYNAQPYFYIEYCSY